VVAGHNLGTWPLEAGLRQGILPVTAWHGGTRCQKADVQQTRHCREL
jgi:hypothetical protein